MHYYPYVKRENKPEIVSSAAPKNPKKHKKLKIAVLAVVVIASLIALYFFLFVGPLVKKVTTLKINEKVGYIVNNSVKQALEELPLDPEFISVTKDAAGNILMIETKPVTVNLFARAATVKIMDDLAALTESGITVPSGTLSGIVFLSGRGREVELKALSVNAVGSEFSSGFESAGINQTRHRLYFDVKVEIEVVFGLGKNTVATDVSSIISENILIGKVPDFYFSK